MKRTLSILDTLNVGLQNARIVSEKMYFLRTWIGCRSSSSSPEITFNWCWSKICFNRIGLGLKDSRWLCVSGGGGKGWYNHVHSIVSTPPLRDSFGLSNACTLVYVHTLDCKYFMLIFKTFDVHVMHVLFLWLTTHSIIYIYMSYMHHRSAILILENIYFCGWWSLPYQKLIMAVNLWYMNVHVCPNHFKSWCAHMSYPNHAAWFVWCPWRHHCHTLSLKLWDSWQRSIIKYYAIIIQIQLWVWWFFSEINQISIRAAHSG